MNPGARKSLYLFLTAVMGALLFLVLQRIAVSFYFACVQWHPEFFSFGLNFTEITALDIITLSVAVLFGAWYGIWVGVYWYHMVYEEGTAHGFTYRLIKKFSGQRSGELKASIESAAHKLERETWQLERLYNVRSPKASSKRTVRRRAL